MEHARQFDSMFIELDAIRVIEGGGDDVPDGKVTDFRRAVQATAEETVAFSWIEWPDKATRDAAMKKMMEDPRMDPSTPGNLPMPFDGKRMIFGGFEPVVEVKA
ncbi:RNA signal recognition particle [Hydrogenophaga sp. Root209]|nr:RNA signal recognition particle [Hydrogenophaga sp. Root209]